MEAFKNYFITVTFFLMLFAGCTKKYPNPSKMPSPVDYNGKSITINANEYRILRGDKGGIFVVKKNAFLDKNGHVVKGKVDVRIKEAFNVQEFMEAGLQTMSDTDLLVSGGMFYFSASKDGEPLQLNPQSGVYASVPASKKVKGMNYYTGTQDSTGDVNWKLVKNKREEEPLLNFKDEELFMEYNECSRLLQIVNKYYTYRDGEYHDKGGRYNGFNSFTPYYINKIRDLVEYYETGDLRAKLRRIKRQYEKKYGMSFYEYKLSRMGWSNIDKKPDEQLYYFSGRVLLPNGKPAQKTRVHIYCPERNIHVMKRTNAEGNFKFKFLAEMPFYILAFRNSDLKVEQKYMLTGNKQVLDDMVLKHIEHE